MVSFSIFHNKSSPPTTFPSLPSILIDEKIEEHQDHDLPFLAQQQQ
jgi:hypothetical protein